MLECPYTEKGRFTNGIFHDLCFMELTELNNRKNGILYYIQGIDIMPIEYLCYPNLINYITVC